MVTPRSHIFLHLVGGRGWAGSPCHQPGDVGTWNVGKYWIGVMDQDRAWSQRGRTETCSPSYLLIQNHSILPFTLWTLWRGEEEFLWGLGFCCFCWPELLNSPWKERQSLHCWWVWAPCPVSSGCHTSCTQLAFSTGCTLQCHGPAPGTAALPLGGLASHSLHSSNCGERVQSCPEAAVVGWTYSGPAWV